jgi:hypothetical protein
MATDVGDMQPMQCVALGPEMRDITSGIVKSLSSPFVDQCVSFTYLVNDPQNNAAALPCCYRL